MNKKTIKGWGIIIKDTDYFWGTYGVGVSPMLIFESRKKADFIMKQECHSHAIPYAKIIPVEITYKSPHKARGKK